MITIVKERKDTQAYSRMEIDELAEAIRTGAFALEPVCPKVCFASELHKTKGGIVSKANNKLCVLQISNLPSEQEVRQVMQTALTIPYSLLIYKGNDNRTLTIVCRYEYLHDEPKDETEMLSLLTHAYSQLHYAYSVQLRMTIDTVEPSLQQFCLTASDPQVYFNPQSTPFFVNPQMGNVPAYEVPEKGEPTSVGLWKNQKEENEDSYEWAYKAASEKAREMASTTQDITEQRLVLLAAYCHKSGLDLEFCIERTLWRTEYWNRKDHVRMVFTNEYDLDINRLIPLGYVDKKALMMMRTEAYLKQRYELRRNELTGIIEYRERAGYDYGFRPLAQPDLNTMTIGALKMGLGSWDKDMQRIVDSRDVPTYNPIEDYLSSLPQWDGHDYAADFAARITSDTPEYGYYLHIWLRSMVAHWMGKDRLHGNALVPLLIGEQGCGKTTLCSMLLPNQLRQYFNDKIDFRSETDIMSALSSYALINIDEFDSLKKSQQPILKYLLSKSEVKFRPAYERTIVERRRFASFIATTNLIHPLQDTTGSRRFACIQIKPGSRLDTETPVPHAQLYAQLLQEIKEGQRYWLNEKENEQLQLQNAEFQRITSISQMIDNCLVRLEPSNNVEKQADSEKSKNWKTVDEIIKILQKHYPYISRTNNLNVILGKHLHEKGFTYRKSNTCMLYLTEEM